MYRRTAREESLRITGQAVEWLRVMQQEPGPGERAAFTAWIALSQEHLKEFLVVSMLDRELVGVDPQRKFDIEPLLARMRDNVSPLPPRPAGNAGPATAPPAAKAPRRWHWAAGLAAAVLLATSWMAFGPLTGRHFSTGTSEQRKIELDDGSVVELNARSRLDVRYSAEARELSLLEGEALFKVARDARRPFRVHSGSTVIQAVGTQFNVNRRRSGTLVAVLEGRVKISAERQARQAPAHLAAGESVRIAPDGRVEQQEHADVAQATSWRQRRLHFHGETLAEIAEEFNRYNSRQIEIGDEAAASRHFNGVFDADDPASFVQFLHRTGGLEVSEESRRFEVRSRVEGRRAP